MARPARTYSMKKPSNRIMTHQPQRNMFDQILMKENIFDDSGLEEQSDHGKTAQQIRKKQHKKLRRNKKTSASIKKSDSRNKNDTTSNRSPVLFCDYVPRKGKMKRSKKQKKQLTKVRQMENQNILKYKHKEESQHQTCSVCSGVSEQQEDSEDFLIEEMVPKRHIMARNVISSERKMTDISKWIESQADKEPAKKTRDDLPKLRNSLYFKYKGMHAEEDESMEIVRDANQNNSVHYLESSFDSPLLILEQNDKTPQTNFSGKLGFAAGLASPRPVDSLLSCERVEMRDDGSGVESPTSEYTYSYVSTYTDVTATGTSSAKTALHSPAVKINLFQPLNSTTYKNKDCIGIIEFPSCISPVCEQKARLSCQENRMMPVPASSAQTESQKTAEKTKKYKTSTALFGSENSCSLDVMNLSTIHSRKTSTSENQIKNTCVSCPSSSRVTFRSPLLSTQGSSSKHRGFKAVHGVKKSVMFSSPQDSAKEMMSCSISPVVFHESDEAELQVDTDEVTAASFLALTQRSRNASPQRKLNEASCSESKHWQAYKRNTSSKLCLPRHIQPGSCSTPAPGRNTRKNSVSSNKTCSQAVRTPFRSTHNLRAVETVDEYKDASQVRRAQCSNSRSRSTKSASENLAKDVGCWHNQHQGKLATKNMLPGRNELCHIKQARVIDSMVSENESTLSDASPRPIGTKQSTLSDLNLEIHQIKAASKICYVNRLCMISHALLKKSTVDDVQA